MNIHQDFVDFVRALNANEVEFVIVGAFALAMHGQPRYTGDLDIWIRREGSNVARTLKAIETFGFGGLGIRAADLGQGKVVQIGVVPVRIDLLTEIEGVDAEEIWRTREKGVLGTEKVFFLGRETFLKNKRAIGRHKDLADVEALTASKAKRRGRNE